MTPDVPSLPRLLLVYDEPRTLAAIVDAWTDPEVDAVVAHTLPEPGASPRVLEKNGFARDGDNLDGDIGVVWRFRRERQPPGRARYQ